VFDSWLIFGSDIQTLPIKGTKWKKKKKKKRKKNCNIKAGGICMCFL
jgi:hypothetical protein